MAYWCIKRDSVFIYYREGGVKKQATPRSEYQHLDAFIPHPEKHYLIDKWVQDWAVHKGFTKKIGRPPPAFPSTSGPAQYIEPFINYLAIRKNREPGTCREIKSLLVRFVIPYFLQLNPPLTDPQAWPMASVKLLEYLEAKGVRPPTIRNTNKSLRIFWRWLIEEGVVVNKQELYLRTPVIKKSGTPLKRTLTPECVLSFAKRPDINPSLAFISLAGYFFSLRPQEIFGLEARHFVGGTDAAIYACSQTNGQLGLYQKLAVYVERQRTNDGRFTEPKANSKGWVACFDEKAARHLVTLINGVGSLSGLFTLQNRELYKKWREGVKGTSLEGISIKDLRRASLYWLGHHTGFQNAAIPLMKHARHKEMETTLLYLRRPSEGPALRTSILSLD